MQAQRWQRIADLFSELTTMPADQRATFIVKNCSNDADLRSELISLLRAHDMNAGPLDLPPTFSAADDDPCVPSEAGTSVGPYRLLRPIGDGGMGSVWLAERTDGLIKRQVALKRPHASWIGTLAARMARERDILASLTHPNIARLYDAGVTSDGRPYLALEYVEGVPITEYCDQHQLSLPRRLELFLQVLAAVRYAHSHLVIHRDIKPSNIMVSADGAVHLLDFGIAKLLMPDGASEVRTQWAQAATPEYASPEHIRGELVSTASDLYSLGVLLTELLAGARPYEAKRQSRGALEEAIVEHEPLPPSRVARTEAAAVRATDYPNLLRALRGDLDNIVLKALCKTPSERYATADMFAQDISCHLRHEPIHAQPGTAGYRAAKFIRRHRLGVTAATVVVLALVLGLATALWQGKRAAEQFRRAETEARTSQAVEGFLKDLFQANSRTQSDPQKAQRTTARELLDLGVRNIDGALDDAPAAKLRMLKILADLQHDLLRDEESVALHRKQVSLAKELFGPNDIRVAEALADLSIALMASQSSADREGVLKEALAILDSHHDTTSRLRGLVLGEFAQWAYDHDPERALQFAEDSAALLRRFPPSSDLAEALIMEGVTLTHQGKHVRAIERLTEALTVAKSSEGEQSSKVPRIHAYLADAYYVNGAWRESEMALREGYRIAQLRGGDDDLVTIQLRLRIALFMLRTSRARQAVEQIVGARDAALRAHGDELAYFIPVALEASGLILGEAGDLESGLRDLHRANELWRQYHAGSSDVISGAEREADLLIMAGRMDEADALLKDGAAVRAKLKDYSTNLNGHVTVRIRWLLAAGRAREALPLLDQFVVREALPSSISLTRLQRTILLARIRLALGEPQAVIAATTELRQSVAHSQFQEFLRSTLADADQLEARAQMLLDKPAAALPLLQRAQDAYAAFYEVHTSLVVAENKWALAECLNSLGRRDEARAQLREAEAIQARHSRVGAQFKDPLRSLRARLA